MAILTEAAIECPRIRQPSLRLGTPRLDLPTMGNTYRILKRLYSLDGSSPNFLRLLHSLIQYDEEERYLTNLKELELTRLLDFLDKVRAVPSTLHRSRDRPQ